MGVHFWESKIFQDQYQIGLPILYFKFLIWDMNAGSLVLHASVLTITPSKLKYLDYLLSLFCMIAPSVHVFLTEKLLAIIISFQIKFFSWQEWRKLDIKNNNGVTAYFLMKNKKLGVQVTDEGKIASIN